MAGDRDDSQRTEEPTQRKLDDARDHGDVVKSTEVSTLAVLAGGTLAIAMFARSSAEQFASTFRGFLEGAGQTDTDPASIMILFKHAGLTLAAMLAPFLAVVIASALAGHMLQSRPVFSIDRITPNLSKLSPMNGLKRLFGIDGLTNLLKGAIKLVLVGAVVWTTLWPMRGQLESLLAQTPAAIASDMTTIVLRMLFAALAILAVLAGIDYFLQRYRFLQRNRMSKQEVKEEFRQNEGDPAVKAKIRQVRKERARRRMMAEVPKATVIVTNPTHFAVALKYESGKMAAPICVAKGMDALALRIREVAEEHDVPIVENPPLARALYASVEIDEAVPPEHFKAVAQVIGYVMRLTGRSAR
ncbi:MAG: flagellar biosynthesis protein FlhB [Rhizomicrobium sp.]|jgi:flagellar biosynthetic protein FlhB